MFIFNDCKLYHQSNLILTWVVDGDINQKNYDELLDSSDVKT